MEKKEIIEKIAAIIKQTEPFLSSELYEYNLDSIVVGSDDKEVSLAEKFFETYTKVYVYSTDGCGCECLRCYDLNYQDVEKDYLFDILYLVETYQKNYKKIKKKKLSS